MASVGLMKYCLRGRERERERVVRDTETQRDSRGGGGERFPGRVTPTSV